MRDMIRKTKNKGKGIGTLEAISEDEMERRLEAQHEEVVAMLEAAYAQREEGAASYLEPLHVFLNEVRENFEARD
jgi:uncharacterized protein YqeY